MDNQVIEYIVPLPTLFDKDLRVDNVGLEQLVKRILKLSKTRVDFMICDSIIGEQFSLELDECVAIVNNLSKLTSNNIYLSINFNRLREFLSLIKRIDKNNILYVIEVDEVVLNNIYSFTLLVRTMFEHIPNKKIYMHILGTLNHELIEAIRETVRLLPEINTIVIDCTRNAMETLINLLRISIEVRRDFKIICYGDEGLLLQYLMPKCFGVIAPAITIAPEVFTQTPANPSYLTYKLTLLRGLYNYAKSMPGIVKLTLNIIDDKFKPYVRPPLITEPTYLRDHIELTLKALGIRLQRI